MAIETPIEIEFVARAERELIAPESVLAAVISVNPGRLGGAPCFAGTRVPVKILFDYLAGGDSLATFLKGFPNVKPAQAARVLELAAKGLLDGLRNL